MPLLSLLKHRWAIAVGLSVAVFLVLYLYIHHLHVSIDTLKAQNITYRDALFQAQQVNKDNLATLEHLKQEQAIQVAALTAEKEDALHRAQTINLIKGKIANAPSTQDGTIAPVLRDTLNSLRTTNSSAR